MRRHNVLEYKSPEDGLTIDDFYKAVGYACCDALRELMKDDIEEQLNKAREVTKSEVTREVTLENIQNIMDSLKLTAEQAMDALKIAPEQRAVFMAKL
jgi:glyoxylate carboligase